MDNKRFVKTYADYWKTHGIKLDLLQSQDFYYLHESTGWCKCDTSSKHDVLGKHNKEGNFSECPNFVESSRLVRRKYEFELYDLARTALRNFGLPQLPARINSKQAGQIKEIIELAEKYKNGKITLTELKTMADNLIRN